MGSSLTVKPETELSPIDKGSDRGNSAGTSLQSWTEPEIAALSVTSDGFVLTDAKFFGEAADLDRNLLNLLVAAEVTPEERADFERLYRERVDDGGSSYPGRSCNGPAHAAGLRRSDPRA